MLKALARAAEHVADCVDASTWALPEAQLVAVLDQVHRLEQRLATVKLALIREIDGRNLGVSQGATSTGVWLRDRLRLTVPAAQRLLDLAKALDGPLPMLREALAAGAVSVEQAQAIAAAVKALPAEAGPEVADKAASVLIDSAAQFEPTVLRKLGERILALVAPENADEHVRRAVEKAEQRARLRRGLTLSPDGFGGMRLYGHLDLEDAAVITAAIDPLSAPRPANAAERDERTPAQRRADALVEICQLAMNCGDLPDNGGDRPQLVVTVPYDLLTRTLGAGTLDTGAQLSPQAMRRLACDSRILPAVLGGASQPLDLGRERRLITGPLRRALVLRDGGCAFPGCDRPPRWCHGHHIDSWLNGGPTALHNAVLLCGFHHRLIHHSDWQVRIACGGCPEFVPPAHIDPLQRPRRNRYHRRN